MIGAGLRSASASSCLLSLALFLLPEPIFHRHGRTPTNDPLNLRKKIRQVPVIRPVLNHRQITFALDDTQRVFSAAVAGNVELPARRRRTADANFLFLRSTLTDVRTQKPSIQRISLITCSNASMRARVIVLYSSLVEMASGGSTAAEPREFHNVLELLRDTNVHLHRPAC
jgi:hypothetical protein